MVTNNSALPWSVLNEEVGHAYPLQRGALDVSDASKAMLAGYLLEGLVDFAYIQSLAERQGFDRVRAFIAQRKLTTNLRARVSDFGEIAAGRLLEHNENFIRPIEKLRYKDRNDLPLHLTDVFCLVLADEAIAEFVFAEVKAGTTRPRRDLGTKALKSIVQDWRAEMPEILFFVSEKLFAEGRTRDQEAFDAAMYRPEPLPRKFRALFLFDDVAWDENVIVDMCDEFAATEHLPSDFACYVITTAGLRDLINDVFDAAQLGAQAAARSGDSAAQA